MAAEGDIKRYQDNLRDELDGAALYTQIAAAESDPLRRDLFLQLAQAEARHAALWREKLAAAGVKEQRYVPSLRTRLLGKLAGRFGPGFVMPTIAAAEFSDRDKYASQADAHSISAEERGHAAVVQQLARGPAGRIASGADIARAERWHRGASGNNLRAAVLGANDGLVSNFCLIMGVAGAGSANRVILLTGLAGLVAGACSMALGEWLSVTNARELALSQVDPKAGSAAADPSVLAAGNAARAALVSFVLFALGAIVPLASFGLLRGGAAIPGSILVSCVALFFLGVATSLFNARSVLFSGLRQTLVGAAAAAVTYLAGRLFGALMTAGAL